MKLVSIIKWSGTATLIIGTAVNSLGYYPEGPLLLALGGTFWVIVSVMWKEPALIVTNTVLLLVGLAGLSINYLI